MRSKILALFSFLGIPLWGAFAYVMVLGSTLGDGVTGMELDKARVLILPFGYLFILFLCCFRFVRGGLLTLGEILSSVLLVLFVAGALTKFGIVGVLFCLPFVPYVWASSKVFEWNQRGARNPGAGKRTHDEKI